jgi:hypothetical protein
MGPLLTLQGNTPRLRLGATLGVEEFSSRNYFS